MVFEYAHTLRLILKETRQKVLSGITHPLKNSVSIAKTGVQALWSEINKMENPDQNLRLAALRAKRHTTAATNRLNLIHFAATLFENADMLGELNIKAAENAREQKDGIEVFRVLDEIESQIASKDDINKGIKLRIGREEPLLFVPRRLEGTPFAKGASQEEPVLKIILDGLLENAATHGEPSPSSTDDNRVVVHVRSYDDEEGHSLCFSNRIALTEEMLKKFLTQNSPDKFLPVVPDNTSGLALSAQLLSMLSLGNLSTKWTKVAADDESSALIVTFHARIDFSHAWRVIK